MNRCAHLLIILGVIVGAIAEPTGDDKRSFDLWKAAHKKAYSGAHAELQAFRTWLSNRDLVDSVNNYPSSTWKASLNQFADLTAEEFKRTVLMPTLPANATTTMKREPFVRSKAAYPSSFDWRTDGSMGAVTSVKDQGSVGTCWAFSTIENIEGQWALAGHDLVDLSPEFLVDCDGSTDTTLNHADCSVFGGWPYLAYQFVISAGGIPSEASWPYCSGTGDCYPCLQGPISMCGPPPYYCDRDLLAKCKSSFEAAAKISSWTSLTTNEEDLAGELYQRGPLSVLLDATQLQFYSSGVWDGHLPNSSPAMGCHSSLDHAVLLVGYGTEDGTGKAYWTVKNSWGLNWGESGYFRIARGEGKCGINTAVTSSIV